MRILRAVVAALVLAFLCIPQAIQAQTTTQAQAALPKLRGNVVDPTGGLMPGADIAIVKDTSVKAVKTDNAGAFNFDLAAGDYQMAVRFMGT